MAAEARELAVVEDGDWSDTQKTLIKQHIAPGISDAQLQFFAAICKRTGLDPFTKQIYTIQRGGKWTIQTGIDGYRLMAARTGDLAGIDDAEYDDEDAEHPNKARVTVWRFVQGQRVPFSATARWREYAQTDKDGHPTQMWSRMPYLMLAKCAEALALRKAFPAELSGVYTGEEMAQADNDVPSMPVVEARPQPRQQPSQPAKPRDLMANRKPVFNVFQDMEIRQRLNALGFRKIQQVEEYVAMVNKGGDASKREDCEAVLAKLEAEAEKAKAASGSLEDIPPMVP